VCARQERLVEQEPHAQARIGVLDEVERLGRMLQMARLIGVGVDARGGLRCECAILDGLSRIALG
jgi:hypothetical protein